ncbi:non-specific lipid-transfer protein-like [Panicum miliaceum]|uniref:Non-specific lipid-transfer protein-like n=1 Tax=Panicum miliaceum TaxID=4540 RepID=A0A3L6PYN4_PANMI|nr:non-specific lipid-transfer protein-like [Panicum miliaceum]
MLRPKMRGLLVIAVVVAACLCLADGKGECGATPPDKVAQKLAPCASAGKNPSTAPSSGCCSAVHTIGKQSPECLCAVMLSKATRKSGIRPEVASPSPSDATSPTAPSATSAEITLCHELRELLELSTGA